MNLNKSDDVSERPLDLIVRALVNRRGNMAKDNRGTDKDLQCDRCKEWFPDDCDIDVRMGGAIVCDDCITDEEWSMSSEDRLAL